MQTPLEITFRKMDPSPAVEDRIRQKVDKLEQVFDKITGCHVVVEAPHGHHHKGKLYCVRIDLTVPGAELVVNRDHHDVRGHEDLYVAVRDAFAAMRRRLEDHVHRRRGHVKVHESPDHGRVLALLPDQDYGKIETPDGRVIYFHRHSVLEGGFARLEVGSEVRFVEEAGESGPQASSVAVVGKHHLEAAG